MSSPAASETEPDLGRLANNFMLVQSLQTALSRAETNASTIPKLALRIINEGAWEEWFVPDSGETLGWKDPKTGRVNPADFREFIRSPRPKGCGCPVHVFERMIWETPAWEAFQDLARGTPGGCHIDGGHNPSGKNQWFNRDDITDEPKTDPAILPISEAVPRQRDYSREAPTGTSVSYTLRRLQKTAPELHERVLRRELSPHAAAVQAGFREPKITVPHDPKRAARILVNHLNDLSKVKALITALAQAAGFHIETD